MMVGMADTMMVSYVGEAAISGVALVDMVNYLIIVVLSAIDTGGAVIVCQYLGRKKNRINEAKEVDMCKNYLHLSKECRSISYDAMTAHTAIVFTRCMWAIFGCNIVLNYESLYYISIRH